MEQLFLVSYNISGLAGTTPSMQLNLSVDTVRRSVRGHATISSLVGIAHHLTISVEGYYLPLNGEPGIIALRSPEPYFPMPVAAQLELVLALSDGWKRGKASFTYTTGVGAERILVQDSIATQDQPRPLNDQ